MYGKLEYSLEQAIARHDRLSQEDAFDEGIPEKRPKTKGENGGALYVEDNTMSA